MKSEKHTIRLTHPKSLESCGTYEDYVNAYSVEYLGDFSPGWRSFESRLEEHGRTQIRNLLDCRSTPPEKLELTMVMKYKKP